MTREKKGTTLPREKEKKRRKRWNPRQKWRRTRKELTTNTRLPATFLITAFDEDSATHQSRPLTPPHRFFGSWTRYLSVLLLLFTPACKARDSVCPSIPSLPPPSPLKVLGQEKRGGEGDRPSSIGVQSL